MSENIGVVDWFTKKYIPEIKYPEYSDAKLDELIKNIVDIFDKSSNLGKIANGIYKKLEDSKFVNAISSDSRFPVCSLFHHLKNTSGVAVCLALQKIEKNDFISNSIKEYGLTANYEKRDFIALIRIASLLHDIGKPRSYTAASRYQPYHYHTTQTKEIIEHILEKTTSPLVKQFELNQILAQLAHKHHSRNAETKLERLIGKADTIASAADRTYEVSAKFSKGDGLISVKSDDRIFPHEINFDAGELKCLETPHTEILGNGDTVNKNVKPKIENELSAQLFVDSIVHGGPVKYLGNPRQLSGSIGILSLDVMGIQGFIGEVEKLKMLRGGSTIVDKVLDCATSVISKHVCKEAVLFAGGGNLLSFIPYTDSLKDELVKEIEKEIQENSKDGMHAAIVTFEVPLKEVGGEFNKVLQESQDRLEIEKNKRPNRQIIRDSKELCSYCSRRKRPSSSDMCKVCKIKEDAGRGGGWLETRYKYIINRYGRDIPSELTHIGDSIAVLAIDGNMMGRIFAQTKTPAEYAYKSAIFSLRFDEILKNTITEFLDNPNNLENIIQQENGREYLGIDVLYSGGDDILIIMNARGAIQFAEMLVNNIAESFMFEKKMHDGTIFKNPIVTLSCGIAIADSKFPIYFLLGAARNMESKAKKAFRLDTCTDNFGIIKVPRGAIAVTAITSAMPGNEYISFVIKDKDKDKDEDAHNLRMLKNIINLSHDPKSRTIVSEIITCGSSAHEQLNLIKFMYSAIGRKTRDIGLDECEEMAELLLNKKLLKASKMIIPHIRQSVEGLT